NDTTSFPFHPEQQLKLSKPPDKQAAETHDSSSISRRPQKLSTESDLSAGRPHLTQLLAGDIPRQLLLCYHPCATNTFSTPRIFAPTT
ncbi:hypothetical protein BUE80_DR005491, partial [Diplocarpon rosae]